MYLPIAIRPRVTKNNLITPALGWYSQRPAPLREVTYREQRKGILHYPRWMAGDELLVRVIF
jgi:hypothetical protein